MNRANLPPLLPATVVALSLMAIWGYVRLVVFQSTALPLTFVVPLLVCVWTRRRWHLWVMAVEFVALAAWKTFWLLPPEALEYEHRLPFFGVTVFNIAAGS